MYSPIKADRWSCGHVLLYLLDKSRKDDLPLRTIGRKPNPYDPKQRSSLLQCCRTFSRPPSDVGDMRNTDERMPSRSRQESMAVEGENTMPPHAKKQKLNGLDQNEMSQCYGYGYLDVTPVYRCLVLMIMYV